METTPFYMYLMFLSPILLISGLIITATNKKNRKIGLLLVIASVIVLVVGFSACVNNFHIGNMN
jgi:hypothetical protein